MKLSKNLLLIISILLSSCSSTKLLYVKQVSDINQIKLIEKIIKNPCIIEKICKENLLVSEIYKDVMCNTEQIKINIDFIKNNFSGENKITFDNLENNVHFYKIENEKSKKYIYFNFRFENNKWLLNNIHGKVEM